MDDFPTRIADALEAFVTKVRAMTVDRVARILTFVALGLVALTLILFAAIYLLVGLFRIVGDLVDSMELAYAIFGGLFLLLGALLWSRRTAKA